jgi:hypothetical protein
MYGIVFQDSEVLSEWRELFSSIFSANNQQEACKQSVQPQLRSGVMLDFEGEVETSNPGLSSGHTTEYITATYPRSEIQQRENKHSYFDYTSEDDEALPEVVWIS